MAQIRFQVHGRLAGSAARDAENEAETAPARDLRVRAGSAARDAEERKRANSYGVSPAGIRLRAQNGSVQRMESSERVGSAVTPQANTGSTAVYKASESAISAAPSALSGEATQQAAPATVSSILRRLFPSFGQNS